MSADPAATQGAEDAGPAKKRALGTPQQVLLGLSLGVLVGVFFGEMVGWLQIVGLVFIRLLQITVIPYISLSLITGLGNLSYGEVRSLALQGGGALLVVWGITITAIVLMPLSFPDWASASFFSTSLVSEASRPDFLGLFVPSNPFYSFANAIVPAVVVFSILIGMALIGVPNKSSLLEPLSAFREALTGVTGMVGKLAPIGVFALMAHTVGTTDIADLMRLQVYVVLYALIALVLALGVLPALITVATPFHYREILAELRTPLITAFATGSVLIVLPMLVEECRQLIDRARDFDDETKQHAAKSVEILIPTAFPFPNPATLMALAFILFAGWHVGVRVSAAEYPNLILVGIPSLFGGAVLAVPFLLDLMMLPSELFQAFLSVDVINSRFGTLLAAMHFATMGLLGTTAMVGELRWHWDRFAKVVAVTALLLAAVLVGVRGFYTYVVVAPYTMGEQLRSLRLQGKPQPASVTHEWPLGGDWKPEEPATLSQIVDRGVLRVCFEPDRYPSAFYNNAEPPQLVGLDIEMAHRLAEKLSLPIEFIAAGSERRAAGLLNAGACDLYMKSMPVTARRTQHFAMTSPVYQSSAGLIVRDHRRNEFQSWDRIRNREDPVRLGIEDSPEDLERFQPLFPGAEFVLIENMDRQRQILEAGGEGLDAIIDMAEQGSAWTVLYPSFNLVVPRPAVSFPVSYAVAYQNRRLLVSVDAWLSVKKAAGTIDQLYRYWMLGEAVRAERPPRWSVIRDVLGWVD